MLVKFFQSVLVVLVINCLMGILAAQETTSSSSVSAAASSLTGPRYELEKKSQGYAAEGVKVTKKFTRRLPNYYKDVVTDEQRDQIYQIQQSYFDVISTLELRLEMLKNERDKLIENVLTREQGEQIDATKKAAALERAKKKDEKK